MLTQDSENEGFLEVNASRENSRSIQIKIQLIFVTLSKNI